jgi:plasmid stability protein
MKTTLDLPDDLVQRIKIRAVQERKPMKRLVADMLTQSLEAPATNAVSSYPEPLPEGLMLNERGFPVFRCGPNAPASKMTVEELLALEQESQLEEDRQRAGISR